MDGPTISEAVAAGLIPAPLTHPVRITFEYSSGATLVLQDEILVDWWRQYLSAMAIMSQIKAVPDPYSMESVRRAINNNKEPTPFRRKKEKESE